MKRKPGEDKAPASPPAKPPKERDQASAGPALEATSEEELEALSPTPGGTLKLTHPIPLPPGVLSEKAMQLKVLERYKGLIEDLFPRAYQLLCNEQRFLGGTEPRELAFIETHGRRWRAGEGFLLSAEGLEKAPEIDRLTFEPANLEASCKMLRVLFPGIKLAKWNKTLAGHVEECHKAIHRAQERRKELLRARGEPDAYGVAKQSYRAFAHGELAFIGSQIGFLMNYLDLRGKRVAPATAERRVLAKRFRFGEHPQAEEKAAGRKKSLDTR